VNRGNKANAGRCGQRLHSAWRRFTDSHLEIPFKRKVRDRGHLTRLVWYHMNQPNKHDVKCHSALWSGSCFQDWVGARYVPGLGTHFADVLTELDEHTILGYVNLTARMVTPLRNDAVRMAGARRLVDAAASAVAANPGLDGIGEDVLNARRTAVLLAREVGISTDELKWALRVSSRTIKRVEPKEGDDRRMKAVRIRLALENRLGLVDPYTGLQVATNQPRG
jgi:hypothetical protein